MKKRNRFIIGFLGLLYTIVITIAVATENEILMLIFVAIPLLAEMLVFILLGVICAISWIFTGHCMTFFEKIGW